MFKICKDVSKGIMVAEGFAPFNTTVYDNHGISSAAANQLASQYKSANNRSNPLS
jgi:hypothetical protein